MNGATFGERNFDPERLNTAYDCAALTLAELRTQGIKSSSTQQFDSVYSSHEGLLLPYEQALVRASGGQNYASSAHLLWIGERTRDLDSAHIEFFRGLANPIGLKVGPFEDVDEIVKVIQRLNPHNEVGKIVVITRFGVVNVRHYLPNLLSAVSAAGLNVVWECDPMHGNTHSVQVHNPDTEKMNDAMGLSVTTA